MPWIPWIPWIPLLAGFALTLRPLWRERDPHLAAPLLLLGALAARQALSAPAPDDPLDSLVSRLGLDLTINLAAAWASAALAQSVTERNRAESVQWRSMEAVRSLSSFFRAPPDSFEKRMRALLELGCQHLGTQAGLLCRVDDARLEILALHGPEDLALVAGDVLPLDDVLVARALRSEGPVALADAGAAVSPSREADAGHGFASSLCIRLRVAGRVAGALCFASRSPRSERFSAVDKEILALMAHWTEHELAAETRREDATARDDDTAAPARRGGRKRLVARREAKRPRRRVDVSEAIRHREPALRRRFASAESLEIATREEQLVAELDRTSFDRVLGLLAEEVARTLVRGARVRIESDRSWGEAADDGSSASPRFVLLSVHVALPADAAASRSQPEPGAPPPRLARLEHALHALGGDLSVHSERGRTSLTAYLPAVAQATAAPVPPLPA